MEAIYKNNLKSLKAQNPILGKELEKIKTNANFDVFFDGERLNALDLRSNTHVYSNDDYKKIVDEFLFENSRKKILFAYGFGLGLFYKELFEKGDFKHIVIFEPDLELIYIAFHLADFTKEIDSDKLFFMEPFNYDEAKIFTLCSFPTIRPYLLTYFLHIHSDYYEKYKENIVDINKLTLRQIFSFVALLGTCPEDSSVGMKNNLLNIKDIIDNIQATRFISDNKNKNQSAVVVSTGPSLAKQLPLLKEYQDRVCIFCIDASYPILIKENIAPDFVFSIERIEETSQFYDDAAKNTIDGDTVFVLASLVHQQTIKKLEKKHKLLMVKGMEFETKLGLDKYGYSKGGQSAAHLAVEFADALGFKNICLIGQDLAYGKDGTTHSKGHIFSENEFDGNKYSKEEVVAYGGDGFVTTNNTWNWFRNYFEVYFNKYKHVYGTNYFNATEGGARINGAIEIPFNEFLKKYSQAKKIKPIVAYNAEEEKAKAYKDYENSITSFHLKIVSYIDKLDKVAMHVEDIGKKLKKYEKYESLQELENKINENINVLCELNNGLNVSVFYEDVDSDLLAECDEATDEFLKILYDIDFKSYLGGLCGQRILNTELKLNQILAYPRNDKYQTKENSLLLYEHIKYYTMEFCGYARVLYEVLDNELQRLKKEK